MIAPGLSEALGLGKILQRPASDVVFRLKTSAWHDKGGLHIRKDLIRMKRLSSRDAFDFIAEDCVNVGALEFVEQITNLGECADGLYTIGTTNESHDRETGYLDGYDYQLVPFMATLENCPEIAAAVEINALAPATLAEHLTKAAAGGNIISVALPPTEPKPTGSPLLDVIEAQPVAIFKKLPHGNAWKRTH